MKVKIVGDSVDARFSEEYRRLRKMACVFAIGVAMATLTCYIVGASPELRMGVICMGTGVTFLTVALPLLSVKTLHMDASKEMKELSISGIQSVGLTNSGKIRVNGKISTVVREVEFINEDNSILDTETGKLKLYGGTL